MGKRGIDISYCQKGLDLEAVKKDGIEFAIIRAGISTRLDTEFKSHTDGAIKAGLPYGFYWYSRAFSTIEAKSEAQACLAAIKEYRPTYPIFYDMEDGDQLEGLTNDERTDIICVFCEEIKKAGYTAGVYINPSWMENYVNKSRLIGKYEIWLAHWTNSPDIASKFDYGQAIWQWGLTKINGMNVDADICYKDYEGQNSDDTSEMLPLGSVMKFLGGNQYQASEADVSYNASAGMVRISNRAPGALHPYHVISTDDGNVYGWVDADRLETINSINNGMSNKDIEKVALEVIVGLWGNGEERTKRLTEAGYDAEMVQKKVNILLKK